MSKRMQKIRRVLIGAISVSALMLGGCTEPPQPLDPIATFNALKTPSSWRIYPLSAQAPPGFHPGRRDSYSVNQPYPIVISELKRLNKDVNTKVSSAFTQFFPSKNTNVDVLPDNGKSILIVSWNY